MNQMEAISSVENRFKKINSCIAALNENFAMEEIHRYRLSIKKLKALLIQLEKGLSAHSGFRFTREFRKFYKTLGKVRNLQLQHQRVTHMVIETGSPRTLTYERMLAELCTEEIEKAKKIIKDNKDFVKDEKKILAILEKNYTDAKDLIAFKLKTTPLIREFRLKKPDETKLHTVRKYLKTYLYTHAGSEVMGNGQQSWISLKANAKLIADWLGEYRDISIGLDLLKAAYIKQLPENEQLFLIEIEEKWSIEKENIRQKIYNTLKSNQNNT